MINNLDILYISSGPQQCAPCLLMVLMRHLLLVCSRSRCTRCTALLSSIYTVRKGIGCLVALIFRLILHSILRPHPPSPARRRQCSRQAVGSEEIGRTRPGACATRTCRTQVFKLVEVMGEKPTCRLGYQLVLYNILKMIV
jgi:hypothetical protein